MISVPSLGKFWHLMSRTTPDHVIWQRQQQQIAAWRSHFTPRQLALWLDHSHTQHETTLTMDRYRWHNAEQQLHRDHDAPSAVDICLRRGCDTVLDHVELEWYQQGQLHRDHDSPAIIRGPVWRWFCRGRAERAGLMPTVVHGHGVMMWDYLEGRHRTTGPAVWRLNGDHEWYVHDVNITAHVREWLGATPWRGTPQQIAEFQLRFT